VRPASIVALAVAGVVVLAVTVWQWRAYQERQEMVDEVAAVAEEYLAHLSEMRFEELAPLTTDPEADLAGYHAETFERIGASDADYVAEDIALDDGTADVDFSATLGLGGLGEWEYDGTLPMAQVEDTWRVDWSPTALHPQLGEARELQRERNWPERAGILDRNGEPLDVEGSSLSVVIGVVGEADEEQAAELGHPYMPGDPVGTAGLQAAYEEQLSGQPAGRVYVADDRTGEELETLEEFPGAEGSPLRTSIDPRVQAAADAALGGGSASGFVAIDPETGDVLAVSNQPATANRAMNGRYPPGSTFKIVTAAAALRSGIEPDTIVECPETTTVTGWEFSNFEDMALGSIPFQEAVSESCNTAFVHVANDLSDAELRETAEDFGFNVEYPLAIDHRGGSYPETDSATERAAAGFGQARVEATPLHMASVAAAVSDGTWRPPRLVLDEPDDVAAADEGGDEDGNGAPETADEADADLTRDLGDVADVLRGFMNDVVTAGTAAPAGLPGDSFGKTGTAEHGTAEGDEDLPTHAWYIGFAPWGGAEGDEGDGGEEDDDQPEIAFAVIVEGGDSGGEVAAPVARDFLVQLGG
jgi:cell division protein FtsI/penicillin-binding protein 2